MRLSAVTLAALAAAAAASPARAGGIVFEAEHCLGLRPNLEIHREDGASGGLAVGTYEGGGGNHTWLGGMSASVDVGTCEYPFRLEEGGAYVVWARAWWADDCGNSILVAVDGRGRHAAGDEHREDPVHRRWHWAPSDPFRLSAGEHVLNVMAKEDDVRVDQWCIAPAGVRPRGVMACGVMKCDYVPGRAKPAAGDLDLSLRRRSEVVDARGRIDLTAYVRRSVTGAQVVKLLIERDVRDKADERDARDVRDKPDERDARDAGGVAPEAREVDVELPEGAVLVPVPIAVEYGAHGPRSEKLLRVTLVSEGVALAERDLVVTRPWRWRVLGPLASDADLDEELGRGLRADLAATYEGRGGGAVGWREPPPSELFNRYGTIDLEKPFGPMVGAAAYLYAEVVSPGAQKVLALVNNDDDVRVYLNGRKVFTDGGGHPAEGYLGRRRVELREGVNRVLVRIGQSSRAKPPPGGHPPNYWAFRLRLRRSARRPADLRGR